MYIKHIWCTFLAVVVDVDDIDSVTMAGTWKQDIVNNAVFTANSGNLQEDTKDSKQIPILLLGNKMDKVCTETGFYFGLKQISLCNLVCFFCLNLIFFQLAAVTDL